MNLQLQARPTGMHCMSTLGLFACKCTGINVHFIAFIVIGQAHRHSSLHQAYLSASGGINVHFNALIAQAYTSIHVQCLRQAYLSASEGINVHLMHLQPRPTGMHVVYARPICLQVKEMLISMHLLARTWIGLYVLLNA